MTTDYNGLDVRLGVYKALRAIRSGDDSAEALSSECSALQLKKKDLSLAWMIVMSILRNRDLLDRAVDAHLRGQTIEREVRDVLRIGAAQIILLDRIPTYAAVSTSTELCKRIGRERASGLVNAVLRKLEGCRKDDIELPSDVFERVAIRDSHPEWLIRRWSEREGIEFAGALAAANNVEPPATYRVNIKKTTPRELLRFLNGQGIIAEQIKHFPDYIKMDVPGHPGAIPGFADGLITPQDPAFSVPVDILDPIPGDRVLEIGCAPGGKISHLAERYGGDIDLHGVDISKKRLDIVAENLSRLGLSEYVTLHSADARVFGESESFDAVLIDAPCTSLGVIRRHPEIRYRRAPADIEKMSKLQTELIVAGFRVLKPGGRLVYCACSTESEEGEKHLEQLLPGAEVVLPEDFQPKSFISERVIRTWPHMHGLDGMISFMVEIPR